MFRIILLIISLLFIAIFWLLFNKDKIFKKDKIEIEKVTAQEYMNVKDIKSKYLYTEDDYVFSYIGIDPIAFDLLSNDEKVNLVLNLSAELSEGVECFKLIAISRPTDISIQLNEYKEILKNSDDEKQKLLLKEEMQVLNNYAINSEIVDRLFYFVLWDKIDKKNEFEINVREFKEKFEVSKISSYIIEEKEIIRFVNLFTNPIYTNLENVEYEDISNLIVG